MQAKYPDITLTDKNYSFQNTKTHKTLTKKPLPNSLMKNLKKRAVFFTFFIPEICKK
jgi:hypothetical protein